MHAIVNALEQSDKSSRHNLYFMQLGTSDKLDVALPELAPGFIPLDIGIANISFIAPNDTPHATISFANSLDMNQNDSTEQRTTQILNPQHLNLQELSLVFLHSPQLNFRNTYLSEDIELSVSENNNRSTSRFQSSTNLTIITKQFKYDLKSVKEWTAQVFIREISFCFYNQIGSGGVIIGIQLKIINLTAVTFDVEIKISNCVNFCSVDRIKANLYFQQSDVTSNLLEIEDEVNLPAFVSIACHASCATCYGSSSNECLTCAVGKYFLNSTCYNGPPGSAYCNKDNICQSCTENCIQCSGSPIQCEMCGSRFLFDGKCFNTNPDNAFCDQNDDCYPCLKNCKQCNGGVALCSVCQDGYQIDNNTCESCIDGYYLYGSVCSKEVLAHYFCDPTTRICTACDSQSNCEKCDVSLRNCLSCDSSVPYLFDSTCFKEVPEGAVCDKSSFKCEKQSACKIPCETCAGGTKAENCILCASGFVKNNGKCVCQDTRKYFNEIESICVLKAGGLDQETLGKVNSAFSGASIATSAMAVVFAASSGFTKSGTSMLSQALMLQKIFYLEVINVLQPQFLKSFLSSIDGGGIISKYNIFNIFVLIARDTTELEMDFAYKETGITTGLMKNTGGAITVQIVLLLLQGVFVIAIGNSKDSKAYSVYRNSICSIMLQMLPLVMLVVFDSLCIELSQVHKQISSDKISIEDISVLILLLVFTLIDIIAIFWFLASQQLKRVNSHNVKEANDGGEQVKEKTEEIYSVIMEVVEEISKRDMIQEKDSSKRYLLVYFAFECVLYPLVSVFCRSDFVTALLLLLTCQLCEFSYTVIVRPFYIKNTNVLFILEQGLQVCMFTSFLVLAYLLDGLPLESDLTSEIVIFSLLSCSFCLLGIFVNPIIQILLIVKAIKDVLEMRKRKKMVINEYASEQSVSQFTTIELRKLYKIQYPYNKIELKNSLFQMEQTF